MSLLYLLNIAFFFFATIFPPIYLTRQFRLGWANFLTIPLAIGLPISALTSFSGPYFTLEDSCFNPYFQYALLVNNVHVLVGGLTLITLIRLTVTQRPLVRLADRFMRSGGTARPERMRAAALVFLSLYVLSFLILTQSFGLLNWLADPRSGYQYHRAGAGQWYALCLTFLSVSMVLATTYARSTYGAIALAPLYLGLVFLLGSKSFIIGFTLYLINILAIRRFRYLAPVAIVILGAGAASTISTFIQSQKGFGLEQISSYSDYYVNAAMYYQDYLSGKLPLFHGQITLSSLWDLVPRSAYPDKPYAYGTILVDEYYFPGAAANTSTPAFATIEYFADFGWPQVILSAIFSVPTLITAFLYSILLPRLQTLNLNNQVPHSRFLAYIYLIVLAPFFLYFFDFPLNDLLLLGIGAVINLVNKLRVAYPVPEAGAALPPA
jgi:hypothetical protein